MIKSTLQAEPVAVSKKLTIEKLQENANNLYWIMYAHVARQYIAWALAGLSMFLFASNYSIGWNASDSMPHKLFIVHKGEKVKVGDIVAFPWDGGGKYAWMSPFKPGSTMAKYVMAGPGDTIYMDTDRTYYVNGHRHARAKEFTKTGKPLTPLLAEPHKPMVIGEHKYYVGTHHFDSMDSRYDMVGLIDSSKFTGKVYVIF